MSHNEVDRRSSEHQAVRNTLRGPGENADILIRDARVIDTDLDNGVSYIAPGTPDPAIYYATDEDADETGDLTWSLEGPDSAWFTITF